MTNYDRIKNMSVEEMAQIIYDINENCTDFCALTKNGHCNTFEYGEYPCTTGIKKWLESEVTEE
jgi:hypothetical protein